MSMFHNPFNSKVVSDITRFLDEHRDDITINPCLDEAAREAAEVVASEPILEDRRMIMRDLFNEAVANCGCKGTTRESSDFAKTVERYVEEGKKSLPPAFLKNIQKKKDAAKKKDGEDKKEEVEEGFAQPTDKELRASVKWLESILKDPKKLKNSGLSREDAEDNLAAAKDMLSFGKAHGSKIAAAKKEEVEEEEVESFDALTEAVKRRKPYEEVYYKWFDRVSVDIMDMTKIAKEIEALLASKADLEVEMPKLVTKYRRN